MVRKRLAAEQIVTKLRQIEVLQGQGKTIAMAPETFTLSQGHHGKTATANPSTANSGMNV